MAPPKKLEDLAARAASGKPPANGTSTATPSTPGPVKKDQPKPVAPPLPYVPFPVELLPGTVARYVEAVSKSLPCDPAYVALPALATLAAAVGMARVLRIKQTWTEPPVLWVAVVGYSGTVKSPSEEHATRPLVDIEHDLGDRHRTAEKEYRSRLEKHKDEGKDSDSPSPPVEHRAVVGDITIEKLGVILADNPKGVLVRRDELRGWFESFTKYSKSSNAPQWLELHRGGSLIIDRKTGDRKTIRVASAAASVSGGIQPDILAGCLTGEAFSSGLAARLLLAMPPREAKRWTDDDIPEVVAAEYAEVVQTFRRMDPDAGVGGRPTPREVPLSQEALALFKAFVNQWGERTAAANGNLAAAFSKLEGYAARFALLHHLVECVVSGRDDCSPVTVASMRAGIRLAEWFAHETDRVYVALGEDATSRRMRELAETVRRAGGRSTVRDLQRKNSRKYQKADDAEQALNELESAGWGRWEETTPSGGGHSLREFILCTTHDTSDTPALAPELESSGTCDTPSTATTGTPAFSEDSGRVSEMSCVGHKDLPPAPSPDAESPPMGQTDQSSEGPEASKKSTRRRFQNDDREQDRRGR